MDRKLFGYVGECYAKLELAKRGIYCQKMNDNGFDFDFICSNGLKIEVKTSGGIMTTDKRKNNYKRKIFAFTNQRNERGVDFYIFITISGLDIDYYIVPESVVKNKDMMTIPAIPKDKEKCLILKYKERWDLLK